MFHLISSHHELQHELRNTKKKIMNNKGNHDNNEIVQLIMLPVSMPQYLFTSEKICLL